MEEGAGTIRSTAGRNELAAAAVLDWLASEEASRLARKRLTLTGFGDRPDLVEDVLSDATVAVMKRAGSSTPFEVDNPAAYGTRVVQNVVKRLGRGDVLYLEDLGEQPSEPEPVVDREFADDLRVLVEHGYAETWLDSAVLACICLIMFPDRFPEGSPAPLAGARPDQARVWPALWFAGERDLFPNDGSDPQKRKRARRIAKVQEQLADTWARYRAELETGDE